MDVSKQDMLGAWLKVTQTLTSILLAYPRMVSI